MKFTCLFLVIFVAVSICMVGCQRKTDQFSLNDTSQDAPQDQIMVMPPEETAPAEQLQSQAPNPAASQPAPLAKQAAKQSGPSKTPSLNESDEIKIQKTLSAAGFYKGQIDGKIGPVTRQAIRDFQTANGLKVDGKVGPQTWSVLKKYLK